MNRQEYANSRMAHRNLAYKQARKLLKEWQLEKNITDTCVIHHRDDTEETCAYNEEHYELWGFNLDGTFEYGKYVIFMTQAEHARYHGIGRVYSKETRAKISRARKGNYKGDKSSMYGKHHSAEAKAKISAANKGRQFSDETRAKMSAASKGRQLSDETRAKISAISKSNLLGVKLLYDTYKSNGGTKKWNDFQKALKTGDITFSDFKITVLKYSNGDKKDTDNG